MEKYIVVVEKSDKTEHIELKEKNIISAMNEAEKYISEGVYMILIAEKVGKVTKVNDYKEVTYKEILANRKYGWHACDEKHSERLTTWKMSFTKSVKWFEIA